MLMAPFTDSDDATMACWSQQCQSELIKASRMGIEDIPSE